jgi:hypothetical protein
MTATDGFGPIVSRWTFMEGLRDEVKAWLPEYLAAGDRQEGRTAGRTPVPRSWEVRHASILRPQAQLPGCVLWLAGVFNQKVDPDDDTVWGTIEFGINFVVSAKVADATGETLHRYVAATQALFLDRQTVGGTAGSVVPIDEDYTGIDPRRDAIRLSAELRYHATGVKLGQRNSGPPEAAHPRPDPKPPWPGAPTVESADIDINGRRYVDPED